jgi:hypothetical protein
METSENPILGTDQTSQAFKVSLDKFFTAKNTLYKERGIPALSSTFAIALSAVEQSKFASNSSATICGVNCGAFANFTNVEMPIRCAPGGNLRKFLRRGGDALRVAR